MPEHLAALLARNAAELGALKAAGFNAQLAFEHYVVRPARPQQDQHTCPGGQQAACWLLPWHSSLAQRRSHASCI